MSPELSVIVPVCNVENYLSACLDSALSQSLSNIEVICVNDGSTDSSLDILRKYEAADARVIVIDKENAGYGAAMNDGLRAARGEYVGILESDDRVCGDAWATLLEKATEYNLDLVRGNYFQVRDGEKIYFEANRKVDAACPDSLEEVPYDTVFEPVEHPRCFWVNPCIWTGLFRRSFLLQNDIWFNETPGASYQDTGFAFKTWVMAKRAMLVDTPVICYTMDNASSSSKSRAKVYAVCDEMGEVERYLNEKRLGAQASCILAAIRYKTYIWNERRVHEDFKEEFCAKMWDEMRDEYRRGHCAEQMFKRSDLERIKQAAEGESFAGADALGSHKRGSRLSKFWKRIRAERNGNIA